MPRNASNIVDHLKGKPIRSTGRPIGKSGSAIGYYSFGKKDMKKALDKAVEELEEEIKEEIDNTPHHDRASNTERKPAEPPKDEVALRPLIDELKNTLLQGFEQAVVKNSSSSESGVTEALLEEIRKLPKELPTPHVEVKAPDNPQPKAAPVRRVRATNIERDENGNISGAEFEVER